MNEIILYLRRFMETGHDYVKIFRGVKDTSEIDFKKSIN